MANALNICTDYVSNSHEFVRKMSFPREKVLDLIYLALKTT